MKAICTFLLVLAYSISSIASTDFESFQIDQPINISGQQRVRQLTPAEKMKVLRKKRERQNELYAKQKIEQWRLKKELEMTKRIKQIFDAQMKALDSL